MSQLEINYDVAPTLHDFLADDSFVRGVVGPFGSGKSSACVMELLRRAAEQKPGPDGVRRSRWAVVRTTYPELRDTTRKTFEQWMPPGLGTWHEQSFTYTVEQKNLNCEFLFRALDRPGDVDKLLSLELTGAYINEAREAAKPIFDGLQGRVGRWPRKADGGATWSGVWFDSNPWEEGHWLDELFESPPQDFKLYWQPSGMSPQAENLGNLPDKYYERLLSGKDADWVEVYVHGRKSKSGVGSYYGSLLAALQARGGMSAFSDHSLELNATFDLGHTDDTDIWLWDLNQKRDGVDFVWHYKNSGMPMSHYFDALREAVRKNGWTIRHYFLPHDARAKTLQTGSSILEQACEEWGADKVSITPHLGLQDGIQAFRWLLEQPTRFHTRCEGGIKALRAYRRRWDELKKCFTPDPVHDWASHTADSGRYVAVVTKLSELLTRKPVDLKKPAAVPLDQAFTLDNLWQQHDKSRGRGRI